MRSRFRVLSLVGLALLACGAARAAGQHDDTPTMTNSTVEAAPEPLPADWPAGAADVQLRGSACSSAYGRDDAKRLGDAGDEVLPLVGTTTANAGSALIPVRHTPFLTRRDIERAALVADPDAPSAFQVHLTLTPEGQAKVRDYTTANTGKCIALVAGGRVLWTATLDAPVEDETLKLGGPFTGTEGIAIVDLFGK